jgi:hypothetical protein
MGQARDQAGNIWETDAQGNAVRMIHPASSSAGRVFSLPPNPKDVRQEARQSEADARVAAAAQREAAAWNASHNPDGTPKVQAPSLLGDPSKTGPEYLATLPSNIRNRVQQVLDGRSLLTAREKGTPLGQQIMDAANQADPTFDENVSHARYVERTQYTGMGKGAQTVQAANRFARHLGDLYEASRELGGPDLGFAPLSNAATATTNAFRQSKVTTYKTILPLIQGEVQKLTKNGAATEGEAQHIMASLSVNQPADVRYAAMKELARLGRAQVDPLHQSWESAWQGSTPPPIPMDVDPVANAIFDAVDSGSEPPKRDKKGEFVVPGTVGSSDADMTLPGGGNGTGGNDSSGGGPQTGAASGSTRTSYDARTSSQIDAMINAGASKGMIDAVLKRQNFPVVSPSEWTAIQGWRMKNPGKKYYGANISRTEDLNLGQRIAGSAPAFAHGVNAATAGTLGAISGEQGQGALDAMSVLHPDASVTGDVGGGVIGAMGAEGAIAARAPAALAQYAPRIADALYGGALGFNTAKDGQGLTGAVEGAGAGLLGGILGQKAMSGAGRVFRGVTDPAVQYLRGQGVPMTVGQVVGNSGLLGRSAKGAEDALTSVPGVGNMIDARRMEGMQGFNRAAFNAGGAPIGAPIDEIGANGVQLLDAAKSKAYGDALDHVTIDAANDPNLVPDMTAAALQARTVPQVGNDAADALTYRFDGGIDNQGLMSGRDFQEAYRGLGRDGRGAANGSYAHEVAGTMREGQDILAQALEGQNPGAFQKFVNANQANRNLNVLADAVNQAKGTGGVFTPHQLNMKDAQSALRLTGNIASASGNRPFADLAAAGQQVLPSKLGDSGTFKRMLVGGLATGTLGGTGAVFDGGEGAAGGTGLGLGTMLLLAAGGSKPAQRIMTKMLTDRADRFVRMGNYLVDKSGIGGWTGAGALTPLLVGN